MILNLSFRTTPLRTQHRIFAGDTPQGTAGSGIMEKKPTLVPAEILIAWLSWRAASSLSGRLMTTCICPAF